MAYFISARGHEAWSAEHREAQQQVPVVSDSAPQALRLNSNENPLGPSLAARVAIERALRYAGRYPMNAAPAVDDFRGLLAKQHRVQVEAIAFGAGSGEILDSAVQAFTSPSRGLVSALPTFEAPVRLAREINIPVKDVLVDAAGKLDLERMIAAAAGAGLLYICNPNNPTATVHPAQAINELAARIRQTSPETVVLIDEAYHDYVMDPAYSTAVPLISEYRNVIVSRTLSKLHGMAGLRLGYVIGNPDTIARLARWTMPFNGNVLAVAAAFVSVQDHAQIERERRRNREALNYTTDFFRASGLSTSASQTNFIWVDLQSPAKEFREACEMQGILVGRAFPPFEQTHCRISIGTIEEMYRAVAVFRSILRTTVTTTASRS
jgi:histidinol-phosphate aminotransferase